ncbi:hypothetical protein [Streptomyces sp. SID13031]|uniref:hypothetical protein n=1 Tax=Streptomyces sp. SID13031 TaxID=2706046 RepID=UPI0013C5788B|nr:hypothetical protein [Streptomyces sp. SID13031]NEA32301.1 hypothetical protein [Streptomyces sp. SID13031]
MSTALLIGTAACSGSSSDDKKADPPKSGETPAGSTSGQPSAESSDKSSDPVLPDVTAPQVLTGLKGAGYKCGADGTYAICTSGTVAVWVLTGTHPRPPVVSLHATGQLAPAQAAVAQQLPKVLEIAHINPRTPIVDWFGKLGGTEDVLKSGDWQADWSVETVDTEEPGVHLTMIDQTCKTNCQAE